MVKLKDVGGSSFDYIAACFWNHGEGCAFCALVLNQENAAISRQGLTVPLCKIEHWKPKFLEKLSKL